ncbi:MAG: DUF4168 domain-containing protein [Leptolyngbyaceae cyanobacterium CAN_BIN12]|nr:DUF4168 domain-containing protein [Leptolyngbyaceae cyanobacterium CAN_BIN12]
MWQAIRRSLKTILYVMLLTIASFTFLSSSVLAVDLPKLPKQVLELPLITRPNLDPGNIPSEKVNQFVRACLQVVKLIERREGDLQSIEGGAESRRLEQEIEAEALAIIETSGLTRQEYLQLLGLANTDPEFGERVANQLQELTG